MSVEATTEAQKSVILTDGAAAKVKALLDQEGRDDLRLRIAVQPGGCSRLRYTLFFDERSIDRGQLLRLRRLLQLAVRPGAASGSRTRPLTAARCRISVPLPVP